jgi:phosphatidylserine decarboxylase
MKQFNLSTEDLLIQDLAGYKNFNEFFYRKLKPEARTPEQPENSSRIVSPADSRSVVYPVTEATKYWIKVPSLLCCVLSLICRAKSLLLVN